MLSIKGMHSKLVLAFSLEHIPDNIRKGFDNPMPDAGSPGYRYRSTFLMLFENQKDDPSHTAR